MIIAILKEIYPGEKRVALSPEIVRKIKQWDFTVYIEKDAGTAAGFSDNDYAASGAEIKNSAKETYKNADFIFKIWAPLPQEEKFIKKGCTIIANFQILNQPQRIKKFAELQTTCFALELIPRISRAQSMDILSSQSNLAGYEAVIEAVSMSDKAVPMMMTAAGTIAPAKVLILGAGVAGLQAIATAKRLGAVVFASDVRPAVKEQVESLGGKFLEIPNEENFESSNGYAKETSVDYQKKQNEIIAEQLKKTDIVITTALIPGKTAPRLISAEMLKNMPNGSIVVDMAAENGGNVEGSVNGKITNINGVKIIGNSNLAANVANSASLLFAKNIYNFISPMYNFEQKTLIFNDKDELIRNTCICKNGQPTGVIK